MNDNAASRIESLRTLMKQEGLSMYMIPDSDFHNSEYIGEYFMCREYMSGFTGSNGILIVTLEEAALWTDGRYFIQAAREIEGSGITLMKMGEPDTPKIEDYIRDHIEAGMRFGVDGRVLSARKGIKYEQIIKKNRGAMKSDYDLVNEVWDNRPSVSKEKITTLPESITGESTADKIARVREEMKKHDAAGFVLAKLDDICWMMNIRGGDVECTPVALSYAYITMEDAYLFVHPEALNEIDARILEQNGVTVKPYDTFISFLKSIDPCHSGKVMVDLNNINYLIYDILNASSEMATSRSISRNKESLIVDVVNPTQEMEAIRNSTQLKLMREYYIKDSAVLTRFLYYIKKTGVHIGINEYDAAMKLDSMRAQIAGFMELSFPTISAYGPNAAMMHYEATQDSHADLKPEGMYLVDSGAQYLGATTDVTRTIAIGPVTEEMKRDFTLVCVGMLRLADAVFLEGCTGRNLDILARGELWKRGVDYKCGTGHGVGFILGVHTGPQNIRYKYNEDIREAVIKTGMTISDEPGVYIEDKYGIRTENIIEVVDAYENGDGHFMRFEHLTWVPIDLDLIDTSLMEPHDIELLNAYHEKVRKNLYDLMVNDDEKKWLSEVTDPVAI